MRLDPTPRFALVLASTPHVEENDGEDERENEGFLIKVSIGDPFPYSVPFGVGNGCLMTKGRYGGLCACGGCR